MKKLQHVFIVISILLVIAILPGCNALGMLLFYRDSRTVTVFKSSPSKKNYYVIKATTLSHCGCTDLHVDNYKQGKKDFTIFYHDDIVRKSIFSYDSQTNHKDTIRLVATPYNNFTTPFDSLDLEIFKRIDSISIQRPKGIVYEIKRPVYKGFINGPYYNH